MQEQKFFIIDYVIDAEPVKTKLFNYDDQQGDAEDFCKQIKEKGGAVNIRTRNIEIPN